MDRVSLSVSLKRARFVLDERGGGGEICAWNVDMEARLETLVLEKLVS